MMRCPTWNLLNTENNLVRNLRNSTAGRFFFLLLNQISAQIKEDSAMIFDEVVEDYCELPQILHRLDEWKKKDMNAYKEAYVHLCLPKIANVLIRAQMILWSPFEVDHYEDIDKMKWFHPLAMYGSSNGETEEALRNDPDVFLVPTVIEKIILPKLSSELDQLLNSFQVLTRWKSFNRTAGRVLGSSIDDANAEAGEADESTVERLSVAEGDVEEPSDDVRDHHGQDEGGARQRCFHSHLPEAVESLEH